jgi:glutaredoxin 3
MIADVVTPIQKAIAENTVVIFSKSWCGFSRSAKNLIAGLKLDPSKPVKIYECVSCAVLLAFFPRTDCPKYVWDRLDEMDEGDAIQSYLKTRTGQGTVPNVFISMHHVRLFLCNWVRTNWRHCNADQKHIGGLDDLRAFQASGELNKLLGL